MARILEYLPWIAGLVIGVWYPLAFLWKAVRADAALQDRLDHPQAGIPAAETTDAADAADAADTADTADTGIAAAAGTAAAVGAHAGKGTPERLTDRNTLVDSFLVALLGLLVAWTWAPWHLVPPAGFAVLVGVVAFGVLRAVPAFRAAPWAHGRRPAARLAGTATGGVVIAAIFAAVLG